GEVASWSSLLGEAGLRYRLTADLLNAEKCPRSISDAARGVAGRYGWIGCAPVAGTLYGGVLSLATARAGQIHPGMKLADARASLLALVDPRRRSVLDRLIRFAPGDNYSLTNLEDANSTLADSYILVQEGCELIMART